MNIVQPRNRNRPPRVRTEWADRTAERDDLEVSSEDIQKECQKDRCVPVPGMLLCPEGDPNHKRSTVIASEYISYQSLFLFWQKEYTCIKKKPRKGGDGLRTSRTDERSPGHEIVLCTENDLSGVLVVH